MIQNFKNRVAEKVCLTICCFFAVTGLSAAEKQSWSIYKSETLSLLPTLHGWCPKEKADRMMELIVKTSPDVVVELGVFGGSSFLPMAAALQYQGKGVAYAIDPWYTAPCLEGNQGANYDWWASVDLEKIMQHFIKKMHEQKLDARYQLMRKTSKEALPSFKDGSINILHIDGNHAEESALFDAKNWLPKVRSGGYIWFDDANWPTTKKAIDYLLAHCELDPSSKMTDAYLLFRKK